MPYLTAIAVHQGDSCIGDKGRLRGRHLKTFCDFMPVNVRVNGRFVVLTLTWTDVKLSGYKRSRIKGIYVAPGADLSETPS